MKKFLVLCIVACFAVQTANANSLTYSDRYSVYNSIDFGEGEVLNQQVFNFAFKGYIQLKEDNKLANPNILSVIDYSLSSTKKRFWVFDMLNSSLLFNEWVSHGKYTGNEYATDFSDVVSSKKSSLGFFVTGYTYDGKHKHSLKLYGQESGYNANAFKRGIVIHGADYVSAQFIKSNKRLGRSYGCPAVRQEIKVPLISTIKDGSCLFSYYPDENYLLKSKFLND